jgi:hypothetical protein
MTPITDRPALDGCTIAGTAVIPGGGNVGDLLGAVYRAIPGSGAIGDLLDPIPLVQWSVQFLLVRPKPEVEGPLGELFDPGPFFVPTFQRSVSAMQNWFLGQTGSRLRIRPEIRTVVLNETDAQIAAQGEFVRDRIEVLLREMGFDQAFTLYAAWYDGVSHHACGGGAWPHGVAPHPNEQVPGHLAALYLRGAFDNVDCAADEFSSDGVTPAINEFKMLHEILHTMGIVSPAAPHHVRRGHVSDDEHDLMWAGDGIWRPSVIDAGHDDYFQTGRTDIIDLSRSVWLDPSPPDAQPPPGW